MRPRPLFLLAVAGAGLVCAGALEAARAGSRYEELRRARRMRDLARAGATEAERATASSMLDERLARAGMDAAELDVDASQGGVAGFALDLAKDARAHAETVDDDAFRAHLLDIADRLEALGARIGAEEASGRGDGNGRRLYVSPTMEVIPPQKNE